LIFILAKNILIVVYVLTVSLKKSKKTDLNLSKKLLFIKIEDLFREIENKTKSNDIIFVLQQLLENEEY
jgi:uncharacterized protein YbcI